MGCWVCDRGNGNNLGTYYFDLEFYNNQTLDFYFCTSLSVDNPRNASFTADLYLDGSLYDAGVNSGTLAPGQHSPRAYSTYFSTIYSFLQNKGRDIFSSHTITYRHRTDNGSGESMFFTVKPLRVFLFTGIEKNIKNVEEYAAEKEMFHVTLEANTKYTSMVVKDGGSAVLVFIKAGCKAEIRSGGTISTTVVDKGATLSVATGGNISGLIWINGSLQVSGDANKAVNASQADIVFDLTAHKPENSSLITNLGQIRNVQRYTISVAGDQEVGTYSLATNITAGAIAEIAFTVDVMDVGEIYKNQYTFVWNKDLAMYSGITNDNHTYFLTVSDQGELKLDVQKSPRVLLYSDGTQQNLVRSEEYSIKDVIIGRDADYAVMVVKDGGSVTGITINAAGKAIIHSGGAILAATDDASNHTNVKKDGCLYIAADSRISGNFNIGGFLTVTGDAMNLNASEANITFDLTEHTVKNQLALVYDLDKIKNAQSYTISFKARQAEGTYSLADHITAGAITKIAFTVDGNKPEEAYTNQYTFVWDKEQKKYTGINYNGTNYCLTVNDKGNLELEVVKNKLTLLLYYDDTGKSDPTDKNKIDDYNLMMNENLAAIRAVATVADINIVVCIDHTPGQGEDAVYTIVGSGAWTEREHATLDKITSELTNLNRANSYSAILYAHGRGIGMMGGKSIVKIAKYFKDFSSVDLHACQMSSFESLYAFSQNTKVEYLVAAETNMIPRQLNISAALEDIIENGFDPESVARAFYDNTVSGSAFTKSLLNVTHMNEINALAKALDDFGQTCSSIDALNLCYRAALSAERFSDMVNIASFFNNVFNEAALYGNVGNIRQKAETVLFCLSELKIETTYYGGLSIALFLPSTEYKNVEGITKTYALNDCFGWSNFVLELYKHTTKSGTCLSPDRAGTRTVSADGSVLYDMGVFSGEGLKVESEILVDKHNSISYLFELTSKGIAGDLISVATQSQVQLKIALYNGAGDLMRTVTGSAAASLSLEGLAAGAYSYVVTADDGCVFDMAYHASWQNGIDYIDNEAPNDTIADATGLSSGWLKGLMTSADDPDWYCINSFNEMELYLWGENIVQGSVSAAGDAEIKAYLYDETTKEYTALTWNPIKKMYGATCSGTSYLLVQGNSQAVSNYNLYLTTDFTGWASDGFSETYFGSVSAGVKSFSHDVVFDFAGKFSLSGEFAGLSGKIQLFHSSGKAAASYGVSKGVLKGNEKLLAAGKYSLRFTVSGKVNNATSVGIAIDGILFSDGDNSDDWQNMKTAGATGAVDRSLAPVTGTGSLTDNGWVGYGDVVDYMALTLENSASLSFVLNSSDATKFTIYQLNAKTGKGATVYSLKSLQNTVLKTPKGTSNYTATTKNLLLSAGTYYIAMQSTNAAKGGSADYSVAVGASSVFFPHADNTNDTWQAAAKLDAVAMGDSLNGWVGYGNKSDFFKFELSESGNIILDLDAATARALTGRQMKLTCLDANGKSVALTALDTDTWSGKKSLAAGVYYLGVNCTNDQKFNTSYDIAIGMLA